MRSAAGVQEMVLQRLRGLLLAVELDADRSALEALGQGVDLGGHGRREHQRLVFLQQAGQDEVDVLDEPHHQHLVGLVENDGAHLRQVEPGVPDEVDEAAWRRHEDVDAVVQLGLLNAHVETAEDGEADGAGVAGERVELLDVLECELPRPGRV